jgi:hypothetical protein
MSHSMKESMCYAHANQEEATWSALSLSYVVISCCRSVNSLSLYGHHLWRSFVSQSANPVVYCTFQKKKVWQGFTKRLLLTTHITERSRNSHNAFKLEYSITYDSNLEPNSTLGHRFLALIFGNKWFKSGT